MTDHDEAIRVLEEAGRDDLADALRADLTPQEPAPPEPDDEGEKFVAELKAALQGNKTSLPGLLDQ